MSQLLTSKAPQPLPGFETDLIQELQALVRTLPEGAVSLTIGRVPGHPEWPEPYFEIIPTNPKAAPFKGTAIATDLDLTIGHSWREFYGFAKGGTLVRGATWQEELCWIWRAVVAGQFTERLSLDESSGKVIAWDSRLIVNGKEVIFRNGHRKKLFGRGQERVEAVMYEPYIQR